MTDRRFYDVALLLFAISVLLGSNATANEPIDFNQQIRPILSDRCFACHGPDENHREGGIRLDQKASAFGTGDSGETVLTEGDLSASELFLRITTSDDSLRMPPADEHAPLTVEQIELIRKWIEQGANWQEHWAFVAPSMPEIPTTAWPDRISTPVDSFVLARLQKEQLSPSPAADPATLLRRVTFDLTGLPPTPAELEAFLNDDTPGAYQRAVDRLLKSPRYGEHMARYWLDAVRYGDTHGLHLDNYREMWPYRDWVIQAFQQNMPYDQFVREQLAGDLLENPTLQQLIATGFNRCHVTTSEGGSIAEEVHIRNVVDRVVTFGTVFLGATFDCSRCHDHKFDPFTQADFYSLSAYFNSIEGNPLDGNKKDHPPIIDVPSAEQSAQMAEYRQEEQSLNQQIAALRPHLQERQQNWEAELVSELNSTADAVLWQRLIPQKFHSQGAATLTVLEDHSVLASGLNPAAEIYEVITALPVGIWKTIQLEGLIDPSLTEGRAGRSSNGNVVLTGFQAFYASPEQPEVWQDLKIEAAKADYEQPGGDFKISNAIDDNPKSGWAVGGHQKKENRLAEFVVPQGFGAEQAGRIKIVLKFESVYAQHQFGRIRLAVHPQNTIATAVPAEVRKTLLVAAEDRDTKQKQQLEDYFLQNVCDDEHYLQLKGDQETLKKKIDTLQNQIPTTLIYREKKEPKTAHILNRGEYDQQLDAVARRTPGVLPGFSESWPNNRLGLANWVCSPDNPLAARVMVNRVWQQLMGTGLVKTTEDFGSQGEPPSHAQLLDWLAVDFQQSGWDIQHLIRQIVLSSTYQQSSAVTPQLLAKDPANRLYARAPRYRLDAEMIRDQALFVAGLLSEKQGGPSVKPPQPDGLWAAVGYSGSNTVRFKADTGKDKIHRRSLYTFIKRTAPPPQMGTFDGPSRESSCVRRERTNTPMQVLLLLNDPQFLECALGLAARCSQLHANHPEAVVTEMYLRCTGQQPTADTLELLLSGYQNDLQRFQADREQAEALIKSCSLMEHPEWNELPAAELASWTVTANLILTLDKTISKN